MSNQPSSDHSANQNKSSGFMQAALREWKRRWYRRKLRLKLGKGKTTRAGLLTTVGQAAWHNGIRVSGSDTTWNTLAALSGQSGSVSEATRQTESALEVKKNAYQEAEIRWNAALREAAEARLVQQRAYDPLYQTVLKQQDSDRSTRSRLEAIQQELAMLREPQPSSGPSAGVDSTQGIATLEQEHRQLSEYLTQVDDYLNGVQPELTTLREQLEQAKNHEHQLSQQKREALTELKKGITDTEQQQRDLSGQQRELSTKLSVVYMELGQQVAMAGSTELPLQESLGQLRAHDQAMFHLETAMATSREESRAMPRGTMAKFFFTVIGIPVVLLLFVFGSMAGFRAWQSWSEMRAIRSGLASALQSPISPYLNHPLKDHPAYLLADRLAAAREKRDEKAARQVLLEMCRDIHLGIYTLGGKQVLAGAERNDQDFFLYNFQRKILARSYVNWNVTEMRAHNRLISKGILNIGSHNQFDKWFRAAQVQRYEDAVAAPDQPENFLPLLLDGLARHQVVPYSLDELTSRQTAHLDVDDIQSFLILLDNFIPAPPPHPVQASSWSSPFSTTVYAGSFCDDILGKYEKAFWGMGFKQLPKGIGKLKGEGAKTAGKGLGVGLNVLDILGKILILRGITLEVDAEPDVIHLSHKRGSGRNTKPSVMLTAKAGFEIEISEEAAKCGWLVGQKFPKNGPLADVQLTWSFDPPIGKHVMLHKAWNGAFAGSRTLTDEAGISQVPLRRGVCPCIPENSNNNCAWMGEMHKITVAGRFLSAKMPMGALKSAATGKLGVALISMLPGFYEVATGGRKAYAHLDVNWHEKKPRDNQY